MKLDFGNIVTLILVAAILVALNVIGAYIYDFADLTEDKRYTLTTPTKKLVSDMDERIYVNVLLDGEFPAGFKRLQAATREMLDEFRSLSPNIDYEFEDPSEGSVDVINKRREELAKDGIIPTNLTLAEGASMTKRYIYPYAIFHYGSRKINVNLLEAQVPGVHQEVTLNNSVSLLEYKFANAIQKLLQPREANVVLTTGQGELEPKQTASFERALRAHYNTGRLVLDSIYQISSEADVLIVAGPRRAFDARNQFKIDQYIMNGGKVIWLIDLLDVNLDSINKHQFYVPPPRALGLEEMWFKYGVRYQPNLVLDLECTRIPQVVGQAGDQPQTALFQWYYHPLMAPTSGHPIVKNLDRINMFFPSTIDTIETAVPLKKTILLQSSRYSRFQITPVRLNFEILKYPPDPDKFDKGPQSVAVLVEGSFESAFKNRIDEATQQMLQSIDAAFVGQSPPTKQLFIADSDFMKNLYDERNQQISALGYNKWERRAFDGNADFILNAVEYMLDDEGVLSARAKDVKLRLLNTVKAQAERTKWRVINLVLPLVFLVLFGVLFHLYRRRTYARE